MATQRRLWKVPEGGWTQEILLAEARRLFRYVPETGDFIRLVQGPRANVGSVCGSVDKNGYRHLYIFNRAFYAHRVAFLMMTGCWPQNHMDHINGKEDHNAWANLRDVGRKQNQANRPKQSNNSSGFKGVGRKRKKWRARIFAAGVEINLGVFDTKEEAAKAHREKSLEIHGQHSWYARSDVIQNRSRAT